MAFVEGPNLRVSRNGAVGLTPSLRRQNGMWSNGYISDYPLSYSLGQSYQGTQDYVDSLINPYNFKVDFSNNTLSTPTNTLDTPTSTNSEIDPEVLRDKMYMDMDLSDALSLAWKKNPWGVSMGLGKGIFDTVGSIWNGIQQYKTSKQALDLANKDYELKKQAYEANEARNQERFNWLRQAKATSQL